MGGEDATVKRDRAVTVPVTLPVPNWCGVFPGKRERDAVERWRKT